MGREHKVATWEGGGVGSELEASMEKDVDPAIKWSITISYAPKMRHGIHNVGVSVPIPV